MVAYRTGQNQDPNATLQKLLCLVVVRTESLEHCDAIVTERPADVASPRRQKAVDVSFLQTNY